MPVKTIPKTTTLGISRLLAAITAPAPPDPQSFYDHDGLL
jgi:hypothetical protein